MIIRKSGYILFDIARSFGLSYIHSKLQVMYYKPRLMEAVKNLTTLYTVTYADNLLRPQYRLL